MAFRFGGLQGSTMRTVRRPSRAVGDGAREYAEHKGTGEKMPVVFHNELPFVYLKRVQTGSGDAAAKVGDKQGCSRGFELGTRTTRVPLFLLLLLLLRPNTRLRVLI